MADLKISALTGATTPLAGTEVLPIVQSGTTVKVSVANLTAGRAVAMGVTSITGPDQATSSISTASNIDAEILSTGASVDSGGSLVFGAATGAWKFAAIKGLATNGGGNSQGSLSFGTRRVTTDATLTEAVRVHASGGVSVNSSTDPTVGNLLLGTGNLVIGTSGKGIDFSVTSHPAGMTSELLNDYEEGTFTPAIAFSVSNGDLSYALQVGLYTKVGRCVTFEIALTFGETTASGSISEITGLPFTSLAGSAAGGGMYTDNMSALVGAGIWVMGASSTAINVYFSGTGSVQAISTTNLGAASNVIRIAGLYYTA
jgi:hypothetical protein